MDEDNIRFEQEIRKYEERRSLRRLRVYTEPEQPKGEERASQLIDLEEGSTVATLKSALGVKCAQDARVKPVSSGAKVLAPDDATLLALNITSLTAMELELRSPDNGMFPSDSDTNQ